MTAYAVWVDAEIHDPTDPDLLSEDVLEGEYDDRDVALARARKIADDEQTTATVYDLSRRSTIVEGAPLLIAVFAPDLAEDGLWP